MLILYYVERFKTYCILNNRNLEWRLFHKMQSFYCKQNWNFFTKSLYFPSIASYFLFMFCNLKLTRRSNINLTSMFLNVDILCLTFNSFLPELGLARVSFKINFSSKHHNNPPQSKIEKTSLNFHKSISPIFNFAQTKGSFTTVIRLS